MKVYINTDIEGVAGYLETSGETSQLMALPGATLTLYLNRPFYAKSDEIYK